MRRSEIQAVRSSSAVRWPLVVVSLLIGAGTARADFERQYTAGHADLRVDVVSNGLALRYHFAPGAVIDGVPLTAGQPVSLYEAMPNTITTVASDDAKTIAGAPVAFLGVDAGDPIWVLPQVNSLGLPFFGFSTENLDPGVWNAINFSLVAYTGPGRFALWQSSPFGGASVKWRTNDGVDGNDSFIFGAGAHDHFNWGFTAPGLYDLRIRVTASSSETGTVSAVDTFRFRVGPLVAVPEPRGLVLTAVGFLMMGLARRKR